jgi:hypothetical protein
VPKRAECKRERRRALLDGIDNSAYLIDTAGIILDINQGGKACRERRRELVGSCLWKLLPTRDIAKQEAEGGRGHSFGEAARFEMSIMEGYSTKHIINFNATGESSR